MGAVGEDIELPSHEEIAFSDFAVRELEETVGEGREHTLKELGVGVERRAADQMDGTGNEWCHGCFLHGSSDSSTIFCWIYET